MYEPLVAKDTPERRSLKGLAFFLGGFALCALIVFAAQPSNPQPTPVTFSQIPHNVKLAAAGYLHSANYQYGQSNTYSVECDGDYKPVYYCMVNQLSTDGSSLNLDLVVLEESVPGFWDGEGGEGSAEI